MQFNYITTDEIIKTNLRDVNVLLSVIIWLLIVRESDGEIHGNNKFH